MKLENAQLPFQGKISAWLQTADICSVAISSPFAKEMPKKLLPIVNNPLIQYATEKAIADGIDTLISVTGRNKSAIDDHFDNNQELKIALLAKGNAEQADMVKNILPKGVECIFNHQPE